MTITINNKYNLGDKVTIELWNTDYAGTIIGIETKTTESVTEYVYAVEFRDEGRWEVIVLDPDEIKPGVNYTVLESLVESNADETKPPVNYYTPLDVER